MRFDISKSNSITVQVSFPTLCGVRDLQRPPQHPRDGSDWQGSADCRPSSPSVSSSLLSRPLPFSFSLLNCKAALTDSTPPTGMQRGRSAAWKWHHHASCGSIHPFSSRPSCYFFTRCHRAELCGITRRMKVGVSEACGNRVADWGPLGCALWWRSPSSGGGKRAETPVKCSARLWIIQPKTTKEREKSGAREEERERKLFFFSENTGIKFVWHIDRRRFQAEDRGPWCRHLTFWHREKASPQFIYMWNYFSCIKVA